MFASGYVEFKTNEFVSDEDAFAYALENALNEDNIEDFKEKYLRPMLEHNQDEKQEFVEWFFSGNWLRKENHRI